MTKIKINKEDLITLFIVILIVIGIYYFTIPKQEEPPISQYSKCPIEYGDMVCINEKPRIPFFNPNSADLINIQVVVPKENGEDIYQVTDPLKAKDTQVLTLMYHDCSIAIRKKELVVKWCCDESTDCYNFYMAMPSDGLTVSDLNETSKS